MRYEISQDLLKKLAGNAAYARGLDYFRDGHVAEINYGKQRITATVQGRDTYSVTLTFRARTLEGACDCPASEGMDFCKHCVAVGLAALAEDEQASTLEQGTEGDRIKAYLLRQPKEKLVDQLYELVADDKLLRQRYLLRMSVSERGIDYKLLKKQITSAIPAGRQLFRYPQVRAYFVRVDELVTHLAELEADADADKLQELVEYAFARLDKALQTVDDSGGFRLDAVAQLGDMHGRLFARNSAKPAARARRLLELLLADDGLLPEIPGAYMAALGETGEALFWQEVQKRWDDTPPPADFKDSLRDGSFRLGHLLLDRARECDDADTQIALYSKLATSFIDYFRLAEFCFENQRFDTALVWLDKYRLAAADQRMPSSRKDDSYLTLRSAIYSARGQHELALADAWTLFHSAPAYKNYRHLLTVATAAGSKELGACRERAMTRLREQFAAELKKFGKESLHYSDAVAALVAIGLDDNDLESAWQIAQTVRISDGLLQRLADASWTIWPDRALLAYRRLLDSEINGGNKSSYRRGIELLKQQREIMRSHNIAGFDELLGQLRIDHKAKRSFMALLAESFGG